MTYLSIDVCELTFQMTAVGPVLYLRSSLPRVLRDGVARKERK